MALIGSSALADQTVVVEANDQMKFSVNKIEAKAGSELTIVLKNVGSMPKAAMGHNLVVLNKDANPAAFSQAAAASPATEYIPPAMKDQVMAATKMLGPKEEDSITFTVPSAPGEYVYLCSFPAHYIVGMKGVIVVTE
jgi:azurin